jgi:DHA2 family multidrug resistance protein
MAQATASAYAAPSGELASSQKWLIAVTVALGAMLEIVDTSIVNVALSEMQASLGATLSEIGWVITSYAIANVIILPLAAWLGDTFGKKNYFVFSLIGFTVSSALCGFATTLPMLIVARVLQGLTGGGLMAKAQSILFETFPPKEQGMAQAIFGIVAIAGPAIGPTLGGYIVTNLDWRWIFFVNVPIGIVAVFMTMAVLPVDKLKKAIDKRVDWLGLALLCIGIGSAQTFLEEGQSEDWFDSKMIIALAIAAVLGLALFVWRQLTVAYPVVNLRVLRHRSLAAGSVFSAVLGMSLYGAMFAVPVFCQTVLHLTALDTGILMMPGALAAAFMMPIVGKLLGKLDPRLLIATGACILTFTMWWLSHLTPMTGQGDLFWPLIVRSMGTVCMFLPLSIAAIGPLPKEDMPAATGFYNLTRQLGGSIGIAFLTSFLVDRQAFHTDSLQPDISITSPMAQERLRMMTAAFTARGMSPIAAHDAAIRMLDGNVRLQAAVMSYGDTFIAVGAFVLVSMPLIFLLGKAKGKMGGGAH